MERMAVLFSSLKSLILLCHGSHGGYAVAEVLADSVVTNLGLGIRFWSNRFGDCGEERKIMGFRQLLPLLRPLPAVGILPWQGGARADTIHRNSVCLYKK
ncbi:unnamed protein product [Prunus armeniaca]